MDMEKLNALFAQAALAGKGDFAKTRREFELLLDADPTVRQLYKNTMALAPLDPSPTGPSQIRH